MSLASESPGLRHAAALLAAAQRDEPASQRARIASQRTSDVRGFSARILAEDFRLFVYYISILLNCLMSVLFSINVVCYRCVVLISVKHSMIYYNIIT